MWGGEWRVLTLHGLSITYGSGRLAVKSYARKFVSSFVSPIALCLVHKVTINEISILVQFVLYLLKCMNTSEKSISSEKRLLKLVTQACYLFLDVISKS